MFEESRALIPGIVDAMLPRFSTTRYVTGLPADVIQGDLAIRFCLRLDLNYYGDRQDFTPEQRDQLADRHLVEFVIARPTNYTKVFYRHGKFRNMPAEWTFAADHDSCWREALNILQQVYFERREPFIAAGLKYHEISERASFDLCGDPRYNLLTQVKCTEPEQDRFKRMELPHRLELQPIAIDKIFPYLREYQKDNYEK